MTNIEDAKKLEPNNQVIITSNYTINSFGILSIFMVITKRVQVNMGGVIMHKKYNFNAFNRTRKKYGVKFNNKQGHQFLIVAGVILIGVLEDYFWYVFAVGFFILAIFLYERWSNKQVIRKSGIKAIDTMSGIDFEKRLEVLFKDLGYKVKRTPPSGDFGADLILEDKKGRTVVQAKRYNKPIGIKAVQEVIGSMAFYKATKALVVTNRCFTTQAERLAQSNGVELWDRDRLVKKLSATSGRTEGILVLDPAD